MKKIFGFLVALAMSISLSSCVTTVSAQDDVFDGEVDATVVISYGTPIFVDDAIAYYIYRGWYYYPYWVNDSYYFHRYRRPLAQGAFRDWYRPIPRGYHNPRPSVHRPRIRYTKPGMYRHHNKHIGRPTQTPRRPSHNIGTHERRPQENMGSRPSGGHRSSTRMSGRR